MAIAILTQQAHGGQGKSMYTSIRRYKVTPDSVTEVIQRAVEGFVPIISRAPGFLTYDLVNTGNDTVTTISTFENQVTAENANDLAAGWVKKNLASFVTGSPMIIGGKISVHKTSAK
jgi:heme-degrading monooxygenase HmoA